MDLWDATRLMSSMDHFEKHEQRDADAERERHAHGFGRGINAALKHSKGGVLFTAFVARAHIKARLAIRSSAFSSRIFLIHDRGFSWI